MILRKTSHDAHVALLTEGVDRNKIAREKIKMMLVALLTEGVDRNMSMRSAFMVPRLSPSSRRAWIEIL